MNHEEPGFTESLKTMPPLRLWVDSDRSLLHVTTDVDELVTRRLLLPLRVSSAELGLVAGFRLLLLLFRLRLGLQLADRLLRSPWSRINFSPSFPLLGSRPIRTLVCALSYVSLSLMFLKLLDMVEVEDWEACRFDGL